MNQFLTIFGYYIAYMNAVYELYSTYKCCIIKQIKDDFFYWVVYFLKYITVWLITTSVMMSLSCDYSFYIAIVYVVNSFYINIVILKT